MDRAAVAAVAAGVRDNGQIYIPAKFRPMCVVWVGVTHAPAPVDEMQIVIKMRSATPHAACATKLEELDGIAVPLVIYMDREFRVLLGDAADFGDDVDDVEAAADHVRENTNGLMAYVGVDDACGNEAMLLRNIITAIDLNIHGEDGECLPFLKYE
jgi:hypothetical protein